MLLMKKRAKEHRLIVVKERWLKYWKRRGGKIEKAKKTAH
jgi:hypothetical protein